MTTRTVVPRVGLLSRIFLRRFCCGPSRLEKSPRLINTRASCRLREANEPVESLDLSRELAELSADPSLCPSPVVSDLYRVY